MPTLPNEFVIYEGSVAIARVGGLTPKKAYREAHGAVRAFAHVDGAGDKLTIDRASGRVSLSRGRYRATPALKGGW